MFILLFIVYGQPGARPTNDISTKICRSLIWNVLIRSQQNFAHCNDVCKISLWSVTYILNWSSPNFGRISNSIEISLVGRAPGMDNISILDAKSVSCYSFRMVVNPYLGIHMAPPYYTSYGRYGHVDLLISLICTPPSKSLASLWLAGQLVVIPLLRWPFLQESYRNYFKISYDKC